MYVSLMITKDIKARVGSTSMYACKRALRLIRHATQHWNDMRIGFVF